MSVSQLLGSETNLQVHFDDSFGSYWMHKPIFRCISMPVLGAAGHIQSSQGAFRCQFGGCWAHKRISKCISMSVLGAAGLIELSQGVSMSVLGAVGS